MATPTQVINGICSLLASRCIKKINEGSHLDAEGPVVLLHLELQKIEGEFVDFCKNRDKPNPEEEDSYLGTKLQIVPKGSKEVH